MSAQPVNTLDPTTQKMPFWQKIGYGVGDLGSNFCWTFVGSFIMIYCTNTLGISSAVVGTLFLFSRILDGISDIIMGRIIDRTHSKMGKARFWYFVSTFPTALFIYILFNVPASFTANTKYAYVFIVYTLLGAVFYTMNNIAYATLTALITKNPKERVSLGSIRYIFAVLAGVLISLMTSNLVEKFGGAQQGWHTVSIIYSVICLIFLLIPFFAVHELPETEDEKAAKLAKAENKEPNFIEAIKLLVHNKYFLLILIWYLAIYFSNGTTSAMGIYYATYNLGSGSLLGLLSLASMVPIIIGLVFVPGLAGKWGTRKTCVVSCCVILAGGLIATIGGRNLPVVLAGLAIKAIGLSAPMASANALIAAADEYSYLKTGVRTTGTIFSCSSLGIKVGTGLGTAISGILLSMGGFDPAAAAQSSGALNTIQYTYLLVGVMVGIVGILVFSKMNVEKDNQEMREAKAD